MLPALGVEELSDTVHRVNNPSMHCPQVWASYLAAHFVDGPEEQGSAAMGSLMQLLVGIASQEQLDEHSPTRSAAAAAVRALTSAALHLGWQQLYRGTPLLLQVRTHMNPPPVWSVVLSFHRIAVYSTASVYFTLQPGLLQAAACTQTKLC